MTLTKERRTGIPKMPIERLVFSTFQGEYGMYMAQGFEKCVRIEDITFIPQITAQEARSMKDWIDAISCEVWRKIVNDEKAEKTSSILQIIIVENAYLRNREENKGDEPPWTEELPGVLRRHLRQSHALIETEDPSQIVPTFPLTGTGCIFHRGGLTEQLLTLFDGWRLREIRQLGFLAGVMVRMEREETESRMLFSHTRLVHTLSVVGIAVLIGANSGLSEEDMRVLEAAAVLHDITTPAGGDTTKMAVGEELDEEETCVPLIWQHAARLQLLNISAERVIDTIQGQGILGEILNLADRFAYVGGDAVAYCSCQNVSVGYDHSIEHMISTTPCVCGCWDSVQVIEDKAVVTDVSRFEHFLRLRARLIKSVYANPTTRTLEHFLATLVIKWLWDRKVFTKESLLANSDSFVTDKINEALNGHWIDAGILAECPKSEVEWFESEGEARGREAELQKEGVLLTHIEEISSYNPGTNALVLWEGEIREFQEVQPEAHEEISLETGQGGWLLHWCRTKYLPELMQSSEYMTWREESRQRDS